MEPRAHHVLIGLFTVVTIAAILLFALWLGDSQGNREYTWYEIGFRQGVSGLSEGSPVQYSGIEVGNVAELRLDPENPSHVLALVRVYEDVPVRENTKASLSLANITGAMTIQLSGGTADSKILKGDRRNPPYIQAEPSQLSALMSNSESLFQRADDFLTNANQFLSEENADNLTAALENLRTASDSLVSETENLNRALVAVYEAAARAEQTFERYERLGNYLDELLEQEGQPNPWNRRPSVSIPWWPITKARSARDCKAWGNWRQSCRSWKLPCATCDGLPSAWKRIRARRCWVRTRFRRYHHEALSSFSSRYLKSRRHRCPGFGPDRLQRFTVSRETTSAAIQPALPFPGGFIIPPGTRWCPGAQN